MVEIKREWGMGETSQHAAEQDGIEMKFNLYALNDRYMCLLFFRAKEKADFSKVFILEKRTMN